MAERELVGERRVLIVDDDEVICDMLGELLADVGYHVTTASDGEAISNQTMFEERACFLQKPFTGTALLGKVRDLLDAPAPG